jgi:transcriptional regulator with XRE-family HTH domain
MRLRSKFTQEELAKMLGLTKRTMSRYETGKRPITKAHAIAIRCVLTH